MIHKGDKRSRKGAENEAICNPAELLSLMTCYLQVWPRVQTPYLLKISGFKIKGLQGINTAVLGESLPYHQLAWNETLQFGLCTCFQWNGLRSPEVQEARGPIYDVTVTQHKVHVRKEQHDKTD